MTGYPFFPADGFGTPDLGESLRFPKVLQGQEKSGFDTAACNGADTQNHNLFKLRRSLLSSNGSEATGTAYNSMSFGESFRFHKVLQGQETFPVQSYERSVFSDKVHMNSRIEPYDSIQTMSSRNKWPGRASMTGPNSHAVPQAIPAQMSSPSSVLTFPSSVANLRMLSWRGDPNKGLSIGNEGQRQNPLFWDGKLGIRDDYSPSGSLPPSHHLGNGDVAPSFKRGCRLFGFSLMEAEKLPEKQADAGPPPLNVEASICSQLPAKEYVTSIL